MLLRSRVLEGIWAGTITAVFRRWTRPTVRPGGTLRTARGVLAIREVSRIEASGITDDDARAAGLPSREHVLRELGARPSGDVYRVAVAPAGPDPRRGLREQTDFTATDLDVLRGRLARLDAARCAGPWTLDVLELIAARPGVLAATLAQSLGRETLPFKRDVRKLKELGLTESLDVGYRLSPRGQAFLLRQEADTSKSTTSKPTKGTKPTAGK